MSKNHVDQLFFDRLDEPPYRTKGWKHHLFSTAMALFVNSDDAVRLKCGLFFGDTDPHALARQFASVWGNGEKKTGGITEIPKKEQGFGLVGGWPTPLNYMKVSWDYSSQYMEKWTLFQTTNQLTIKGLNQRPHTHSTVTFEWVTSWLLQTSPRSFRLDTGQKVPLKDHCFWSEPFRLSSSRGDWS